MILRAAEICFLSMDSSFVFHRSHLSFLVSPSSTPDSSPPAVRVPAVVRLPSPVRNSFRLLPHAPRCLPSQRGQTRNETVRDVCYFSFHRSDGANLLIRCRRLEAFITFAPSLFECGRRPATCQLCDLAEVGSGPSPLRNGKLWTEDHDLRTCIGSRLLYVPALTSTSSHNATFNLIFCSLI